MYAVGGRQVVMRARLFVEVAHQVFKLRGSRRRGGWGTVGVEQRVRMQCAGTLCHSPYPTKSETQTLIRGKAGQRRCRLAVQRLVAGR